MARSNLARAGARASPTRFSASANAKHLIHGQKCWPPAPIGVVPSGSRQKARCDGLREGGRYTIIALRLFPVPRGLRLPGLAWRAPRRERRKECVAYRRQRAAPAWLHEKHKLREQRQMERESRREREKDRPQDRERRAGARVRERRRRDEQG